MSAIAFDEAPVTFTDAAALKVWELLCEEGNFDLKLRAFITGGGCSGFQYGFSFDQDTAEEDTVVTKAVEDGKVELIIDPIIFQYLLGAEIDFKKDLSGEQFIIRNPNAKTTCGCGSSFSV